MGGETCQLLDFEIGEHHHLSGYALQGHVGLQAGSDASDLTADVDLLAVQLDGVLMLPNLGNFSDTDLHLFEVLNKLLLLWGWLVLGLLVLLLVFLLLLLAVLLSSLLLSLALLAWLALEGGLGRPRLSLKFFGLNEFSEGRGSLSDPKTVLEVENNLIELLSS